MSLDKAILIQGPAGSGKTKLAKVMAKMAGLPYSVVSVSELNRGPFALAGVLLPEPKTVIVEEFTGSDSDLQLAKSLVTSKEIEVPVQGQASRVIKTPNFIFCSGSKNPLNLGEGDRRFEVVNLAAPDKEL
jgi:cytidylate kinase